jgi:aspartyl-tRNA(Asn)/glutamyl-tRNA(Gln) amidotransferase subunit A
MVTGMFAPKVVSRIRRTSLADDVHQRATPLLPRALIDESSWGPVSRFVFSVKTAKFATLDGNTWKNRTSIALHRSLMTSMRATQVVEHALIAARSVQARHAFVRLFEQTAMATAAEQDAQSITSKLPLLGRTVSIKDLFDVAGHPSTAGSASLQAAAPATADAPAVARLRQAGALLIGHTNLSEFAFSGVGLNPYHGTPANSVTAGLDAAPRIPGGSTSGGAVSVAVGAAWAALGSDTGGSIRIPAALQGLVGFKSTARLVPTQGCIPLSTTLDTTCAITQTVHDAVLMHEVLAARKVSVDKRPLTAWRFALPRTVMVDGLDPQVSQHFFAAVESLRKAGAQIEEIDLPPLADTAALVANGGFSAAESWAWHRARLAEHGHTYDPRVLARIRRGELQSAADYIDLLNHRRQWIATMTQAIAGFDALISPTVPIVAPPIAPLLESDEAFFATNALLLRNPSLINLLDGCAISLPCHPRGQWPVGLMVWHGALADDRVLSSALCIEQTLHATRQTQ